MTTTLEEKTATARAAIADLPHLDTDPSDFTVEYSIRAQVANVFNEICDVRDNLEEVLLDDEGEYPGFQAVEHKLAEAHGAVMSALQAARQAQPNRR